MFIKVTLLILIVRFPYKTSSSSVCIPNTQTLLNGKICTCNISGHWSDQGCHSITRRQSCTPGKVVFQGCSRCICQESGLLECSEDSSCSGPQHYQSVHETLTSVLPSCNPFKTYYINCNICICPASGKTVNARCAQDISCTFFREPTTAEISNKKNTCIPNVMYLFPCLHCLCSSEGYFNLDKCVATCVNKQVEPSRRCIPNTLYKNHCNVCLCPNNSVSDNRLCTNSTCVDTTSFGFLRSIKSKPANCTPHEFLMPRCIYCDCNRDGIVDDRNCIELECLHFDLLKYDSLRETCSPGEIVPYCTECFCPRNGTVSDEFCSKGCSHQSKLKILEKIVNLPKNNLYIDHNAIKSVTGTNACKPGTIYIDQGRYCLCPSTVLSNFNLCTATDKNLLKTSNGKVDSPVAIDLNMTCEPSTFVEFDCNTCFCSKKGKIDPMWCTYDDCEAKSIVQASHVSEPTVTTSEPDVPMSTTCTPGSISSVDCNFCICPDNGLVGDRVCTKNDCSAFTKLLKTTGKFACEPLAYYEVDCNICFCPHDGIKNVAKCTKNHCEKNSLRSDVCVPGHLFSDDCNVCVCPMNGNKAEKACNTHHCSVPWKKIFLLSESLLSNQITEDATRNLDMCFPGEEFVSGCNLCICPDVGLRLYATCSPTFCEEDHHVAAAQELEGSNRENKHVMLSRREEDCEVLDGSSKAPPCTPGSMYIIKCQECICPYLGDIRHFCREMPEDTYCEQAFPGYDYLPARRDGNSTENSNMTLTANGFASNYTSANGTVLDNHDAADNGMALNYTSANETALNYAKKLIIRHEHTRFGCSERGRVTDECFICSCDGSSIIAEHCYQSNATECLDAVPSFLQGYVKTQIRAKSHI